jgi:phosphate:Na+ symporter
MSTDLVFNLMGGLGLFFFGMRNLSDGLKKVAGNKLRDFLNHVTKNRLSGIFVGTFITVLIQSSSATTVLVVGFVNAGLLGLKQAITVIMGANIGTTFTAWLISSMSILKITTYALPAVGIGFAIMALTKRKKQQSWGQILLGFGILFIGLGFMKDAFAPLKGSPILTDIFTSFSVNPILGVLAGIVFTVLLQSSSATIAIVQVLAFNGVISFEAAIPIILGDNIGTTITAQLAAIGGNLNARRAAMSHTVFNVVGTAYMLIFVQLGLYSQFIAFIIPGEMSLINIMFYIAVAHSVFNVVNTIIFIPFVGLLEKVSIALVKEKGDSVDYGTQYLEKHLLDSPSLALEQIHKENVYMLKVAHKAAFNAAESFFKDDLKKAEKASEYETATDNLQSEITQYLVELSQRTLSKKQSQEIPVLIHNVNDLERIGDHSQNISELAKRKVDDKLIFSDKAIRELNTIWENIEQMFKETEHALENNDIQTAQKVLDREKQIDKLQEEFKESHLDRLNNKKCNLDAGFIFLELVDNLEKIGDRLTNVAQSVIGKMRWKLKIKDEHQSSL